MQYILHAITISETKGHDLKENRKDIWESLEKEREGREASY